PKCQVQLNIPEVSFGTLYTCENCQAVFFVDWSGNPEAPMETPGEVPMETPAEAPLESSLEPPLESPIAESPLEFEPVVAPPLEPMVVQESAIEVTDQPNFQEVVNFGNEIETNKVMTYSLYIEGIEIADLRSKFHEAITDSRFQWDAEEIM